MAESASAGLQQLKSSELKGANVVGIGHLIRMPPHRAVRVGLTVRSGLGTPQDPPRGAGNCRY